MGIAYFLLPKNLNFILLKRKERTILYTYNKSTYFSIPTTEYIYINKVYNFIKTINSNKNQTMSQVDNYLYKIFKSLNSGFFVKLRFTGKSYKIEKTNNFIQLYFGHSHTTVLLKKIMKFKKIGKNKLILSTRNQCKLNVLSKKTTNVRSLNIYTKRGLRAVRSIAYKRTGKKSTF
jgi:ribosomal protein L6P/L9E